MQLTHWYIQGKQPDQQYPSNLILAAKLVRLLELVFQQSVVLVLININSRVSCHQYFFYFGMHVAINEGDLFYPPTCMGKTELVHLKYQK